MNKQVKPVAEANADWCVCPRCKTLSHTDDMNDLINGVVVCNDCYTDFECNFSECANCGNHRHNDDLVLDAFDDAICTECVGAPHDESNSTLLEWHHGRVL